MSNPSLTARLTVKVALALVLLKIGAFAATGSSGILGSMLDSMLDTVASLLVLWAVITAAQPADADHPWGHGKAEALASLFQSILILISGLGLGAHAINRFISPDTKLEMEGFGIATMALSSIITLWLVKKIRTSARESGSPALEADSAHYASDLWANFGVISGLGISQLQKATWPDIAVGLGIALIILNTAKKVFKESIGMLMDEGLKPGEEGKILAVVMNFSPQVLGFHNLRTRKSGSHTFLELHLDLDSKLSFTESHDLSEKVGKAIEETVPHCEVTVHADPLEGNI